MCQNNTLFGWSAVFKQYDWRDLLKDCICPLIITIIIVLILKCISSANIYHVLQNLVNVGLSVAPTMVALILAAYTIILAFIISDKMNAIKDSEESIDLIKGLNAGFASCLLFSIISMILLVVTSIVMAMKIYSPYSDAINLFVFFIICFFVFLSITILLGVIIDIFNSGQTTLIDEPKETKKRKDETSSTSV